MPAIFVATGLTAESVSAADGEVQLAMTLGIENIGGPIVDDVLEVNVAFGGDGIDGSLTLSIPAANEIAHEFTVAVPPGVVRFDIEIHGESFPFDRVAKAADLEIVGAEWEAVSDGRISVDVTVRNTGNADAEGVIVIGAVEVGDDVRREGEGQTDLVAVGETATVQLLLDLPADEHDIELQVSTTSLEANVRDNIDFIEAEVTYVEIAYDYLFTPGGYWSDGSANVEISVVAINSGVGAFNGAAEMSYSCEGAGILDDVETGKFEFTMPDGFSAVTESVTLRSTPGTLECRFRSQEQGSETHEFDVPAKIVGVSREVWECYSDDTINRHGDIGCAGREDERVVKWDLNRPLRVWATGDQEYIDVMWQVLDRLSPLLDMTFANAQSEDDADLRAWVGIAREDAPAALKSGNCVDAAGCAITDWGNDRVVYGARIGVWTVDSNWLLRTGLVDRRIEHVTLHELLHVLAPIDHRDDALSVVNNISGPDWIELDPSEEALIRFQRNPAIKPGMTMDEVRSVIVLEDELLDYVANRDAEMTPMEMLREAYRRLQAAGSVSWRMEGGWRGARCDKSFGRADYTIAELFAFGPGLTRFFAGSDKILLLGREDWSREAGEWLLDDPKFWERTVWRTGFSQVHDLLVSALYFASDDDFRVSTVISGETSLRFLLERTITWSNWYRSAELRGRITLDNNTLEIKAYEMDWLFDVIRSNSCDRFVIRTTDGQYGVQLEVPDEVYERTTSGNRAAIDNVNGPRR